MYVNPERNFCLSDASFFFFYLQVARRQATGASHQVLPPSEGFAIMSGGENSVPLKSVLNQTQLFPLFSLIISTVDHVPLVSLLTRAWASVKVMLGQAR